MLWVELEVDDGALNCRVYEDGELISAFVLPASRDPIPVLDALRSALNGTKLGRRQLGG